MRRQIALGVIYAAAISQQAAATDFTRPLIVKAGANACVYDETLDLTSSVPAKDCHVIKSDMPVLIVQMHGVTTPRYRIVTRDDSDAPAMWVSEGDLRNASR
jgi:hypothetical protein